LLYNNKNWTVEARDAKRITAVEMKYIRNTEGPIIKQTQIAKELNITLVFF